MFNTADVLAQNFHVDVVNICDCLGRLKTIYCLYLVFYFSMLGNADKSEMKNMLFFELHQKKKR